MKREREKHITRLHIILFCLFLIFLITIFVIFKVKQSESINKYHDLEKEMVNAADKYYQINNLVLADGNEKRITLNQLKKQNLIYSEIASKCKGYVLSTSEKNFDGEYEITNTAYIKCSNKYMTSNYEEY